MRAAIYCRISLDRTGEGAGVSRQLEDCTTLVEQAGWTIHDVYTDNDISASSGKPRPDYRRMLRAIEQGQVDVIVAWAPDRLYRRLADLEELIKIIDRQNIAIRTVRAGEFDLSTAMGKMLARILGSVAQGEGDMKSERWRRSIQQRREAGQAPGWGPRLFGYNRDGTINEDEREVVDWIVSEVTEGVGLTRMCHMLNERGITTTLGNPWRLAALRKFLSNPRLAGHSTLNGDIIGPGTWAPILDEETWETVRALAVVKRATPPRPRVALLAGLIFCGKCGTKMQTAGRARRGDGEPQRIYRCANTPGMVGCGGVSVDAEAVEEVVETYARERLNDPKVRANIEAMRAAGGSSADALEVGSLDERIRELEAQLDEPGIPVDTLLRAISSAKGKREELLARVARSDRTPLPARGGAWPTDLGRRRALVMTALEGREVIVDPALRGGVFDPMRVRIESPLP